jgi:hypothetical protein
MKVAVMGKELLYATEANDWHMSGQGDKASPQGLSGGGMRGSGDGTFLQWRYPPPPAPFSHPFFIAKTEKPVIGIAKRVNGIAKSGTNIQNMMMLAMPAKHRTQV